MTVKHKDHRENDDDGIGEQSEERTARTEERFVFGEPSGSSLPDELCIYTRANSIT